MTNLTQFGQKEAGNMLPRRVVVAEHYYNTAVEKPFVQICDRFVSCWKCQIPIDKKSLHFAQRSITGDGREWCKKLCWDCGRQKRGIIHFDSFVCRAKTKN